MPLQKQFSILPLGFLGLSLFLWGASAAAQMKTGADMPGYQETFGLQDGAAAKDYAVQEIEVTAGKQSMANVLWPGESIDLTLRFTNKLDTPWKAAGKLEVVRYGTSVPVGDFWEPHVFRISDQGAIPIAVDLPPHSAVNVKVHPPIPEVFGGYGLIVDLPGHGRAFAATIARVLAPDPGRVQFPTYALDTTWDEFMNEGVFVLFEKLGVKGMRMGASYNLTSDPEYQKSTATLDRYLQWSRKHDVTVMLTLGAGEGFSSQPLARPRPWLSPSNEMLDTKDDRAWLPEHDGDFQNWVEALATKYGWPRGNVNAMELWNEPWESVSISGWQADIPRYRDIFTHMALGIEAAREHAGVKVLIGGTSSSSNARDKLFPDGSDYFLKWLDFVSIHYQALAADPSLVPEWVNRKSAYGPVKVWDTESWIANSEDRIAGVIASMRAQGQGRTAGIFDGNVYESKNIKVGADVYPVVQAWSPAAAVAASQKFIGQRRFDQLLFQNGLPWVFVFSGLPNEESGKINKDDGTLVVVGDLRKIYEPERTLFRSVKVDADAALTISDASGKIRLYDFYGNIVAVEQGKIRVPLNGLGYFLRTDGSAGSFDALLQAVRDASIKGYAPVELVARDMTAPVTSHPSVRLNVTNVLNRRITGELKVALQGVELSPAVRRITLPAGASQTVEFPIHSAKAADNNLYPLDAMFDAGPDGRASLHEDLRVNFIAHKTIHVDGNLSDWDGVLPVLLPGVEIGKNLTEQAWLPFKNFDKTAPNGLSTVYLAYDDKNFYFAAKISDSTPDPGMVRFATRDDDSYFYPETVSGRDHAVLTWPAGVRHYSYRKNFDIPSGSSEHDNVQVAFNVLPNKPWLSNPPGVMPRFITYWDTDYEFALNPVAEEYGGGTEIWRLLAPGMPRKHFFPRQPKSPIDGGAVADGKLVIWREENTRFVEAAIPWHEMPDVLRRIQAGETIKFTCRINDNKGPEHELAAGRSISKINSVTFHDDWQTHWANELEFGAEK
jgi:hypothetical protein